MNQISWTRLVFGSETIWQKNHNPGIRALLESEEDTYATLRGASDRELDAFLMQIGEYIFVEFSKTGNGAYAYRASDLPFDLHAISYAGSTSDLKRGYYKSGKGVAKIMHTIRWQDRTANELGKLGIYPDLNSSRQEPAVSRLSSEQADALKKIGDLAHGSAQIAAETLPSSGYTKQADIAATNLAARGPGYKNSRATTCTGLSTKTSRSTQALSVIQVCKVTSKYKGAKVTETGTASTRRIWVTNPGGWVSLEVELKRLGFQWAINRKAWYWAED